MSLYDELKPRYRGFKRYTRGYGVEIETETRDYSDWPSGLISPPTYDEEMGDSGWYCEIPNWKAVLDGSLRNFGMEFVSEGVQSYPDIIESLRVFGKSTKHVPFIEDAPHTSVHVHINMLEEEITTMANFVTLWFLYENILMKYSGPTREANLFSMPARLAEQNVRNFVYLFNRLGNGEKSPLAFSQEESKYAALNIGCLPSLGSIEVRSFRGTTDVEEIIDWISIIEKMMNFSRQEGMTPDTILQINKEETLPLFSAVFGSYRHKLSDGIPDLEFYIFRNIWYASQIAASVKDWKSINTVYSSVSKEEKKAKKDGYTTQAWVDEVAEVSPEIYWNNPVPPSPPLNDSALDFFDIQPWIHTATGTED